VATILNAEIGGTLHEITSDTNYGGFTGTVRGLYRIVFPQLPDLTSEIPDYSQFDVIFVLSPVWGYRPADPVLTFLEKSDFQGKTVIPMATARANVGDFYVEFERLAKNGNVVIKPLELYSVILKSDDFLKDKIQKYLAEL
jgi:flavodoxin